MTTPRSTSGSRRRSLALLLILLAALPLLAASASAANTPADEAARLEAVAKEVNIRQAVRKLTALEAQDPPATEAQLTAAREAVAQARAIPLKQSSGALSAGNTPPVPTATTAVTTPPYEAARQAAVAKEVGIRKAVRQLTALEAQNPPATEAQLTAAREAVAQARAVALSPEAEKISAGHNPRTPVLGTSQPTPAQEAARLQALTDVVSARRVSRELQAKIPRATEAELAAAREAVREAEARWAKFAPAAGTSGSGAVPTTTPTPLPENGLPSPPTAPKLKNSIRAPDADLETVAKLCEIYFGGPVTIADRVKPKWVSITVGADTPEELREKFTAELRKNGLYLVNRPDGKVLDSEPGTPLPARP